MITSSSLDDEALAGIVTTLAIVGDVIAARHAVEATHGTAAESAAIAALGDALTHLEDAYGALRSIHEATLKDD